MPSKNYSAIYFFGIVLSILFEFLGVLFVFGVVGYYIQTFFFKENFIVLVLFLFFGMSTGIYFMFKRAKKLSHIQIEDKEFKINSLITNKEKETEERIKKVRKEIEEYEKILDKRLKKEHSE